MTDRPHHVHTGPVWPLPGGPPARTAAEVLGESYYRQHLRMQRSGHEVDAECALSMSTCYRIWSVTP